MLCRLALRGKLQHRAGSQLAASDFLLIAAPPFDENVKRFYVFSRPLFSKHGLTLQSGYDKSILFIKMYKWGTHHWILTLRTFAFTVSSENYAAKQNRSHSKSSEALRKNTICCWQFPIILVNTWVTQPSFFRYGNSHSSNVRSPSSILSGIVHHSVRRFRSELLAYSPFSSTSLASSALKIVEIQYYSCSKKTARIQHQGETPS